MTFIAFLKKLRIQHRALPSFNVFNLETVQAVAAAASIKHCPVIIQVSEKALAYAGFESLVTLIASVWNKTKLPLFLHLDHGKDLTVIKKCINSGFFTSVHIDASDQELSKNIKLTKKVVDWAHPKGVAVQGELGTILGREGYKKLMAEKKVVEVFTPLEQIKEYIAQSGLDYLAVSIGNIHGNVKRSKGLDYARLKKIYQITNLPLVLHGGSGFSNSDLRRVRQLGVTVVNIDSDLRAAFLAGFAQGAKKTGVADPRVPLSLARDQMTRVAEAKINSLAF
ncbi:MAG: class II fructose-bisphosphate aldolase [Candidatus Komeilibacteria bacterium]|nr:class II fructose-bisphosphate aldolase [Candidatus Komeilibacteria bacterium]